MDHTQTLNLDTIFGSLSDPTRRDILQRLMGSELTVGEIAKPYTLKSWRRPNSSPNAARASSNTSASRHRPSPTQPSTSIGTTASGSNGSTH
jgi:hypothetical protein